MGDCSRRRSGFLLGFQVTFQVRLLLNFVFFLYFSMSFLFKHAVLGCFGIQKVGHWSRWSPCAVPRRPLSVVPTCGRCCMPMGPAPFPWPNGTKPLTMRLALRKWGRLMNFVVFKNRLFFQLSPFFLGTSRFLTSTLKDFSGWVGLVVGSVYVSKSS